MRKHKGPQMSCWPTGTSDLTFEVWAGAKSIDGSERMQCMAAFYFWPECLDYKDYCVKRGAPIVIRSLMPSGEWQVREYAA